jgi:hypothetical protein
MIHPTAAEVLATIQTGFEADIVPNLSTVEAQSAAATISHLLRHVALRVEQEGQILSDDIGRLRALLGEIADWLESEGEGDPAVLREAAASVIPAGTYPSLTLLGEQALAMRGALVSAQETLHGLGTAYQDHPGHQALREAIRTYIAAQLADEARLIAPAFLGKGPRR